jgi:hypothetical protein
MGVEQQAACTFKPPLLPAVAAADPPYLLGRLPHGTPQSQAHQRMQAGMDWWRQQKPPGSTGNRKGSKNNRAVRSTMFMFGHPQRHNEKWPQLHNCTPTTRTAIQEMPAGMETGTTRQHRQQKGQKGLTMTLQNEQQCVL